MTQSMPSLKYLSPYLFLLPAIEFDVSNFYHLRTSGTVLQQEITTVRIDYTTLVRSTTSIIYINFMRVYAHI